MPVSQDEEKDIKERGLVTGSLCKCLFFLFLRLFKCNFVHIEADNCGNSAGAEQRLDVR